MQYDLLQGDTIPDKKAGRPVHDKQVSQKQRDEATPDKALPAAILHALDPNTSESEFVDKMDQSIHHRNAAADKAPDALKTIGEAAEILSVPQHVLRFWESRFPQIRPVKSRGGRRYYRPDDIKMLTMIKHLLYKEGYTIKGAKKAFQDLKKQRTIQQGDSSHSARNTEFPLDQVVQRALNKGRLSAAQIGQISDLRQDLLVLRDTLKSML